MIVSLVLALALIPTALVIASDIFSDVPDGHIFHNDINAIFGARITTGRTPTTYVPEDPVLRGEMAAFLHRGLGRIASYNTYGFVNLSTDVVNLAEITLNPGGAPGGTGFVKLDGVVNSSTQLAFTTGCPCTLQFFISQSGGETSDYNFTNLYNASGGVQGTVNGAVTWAVSVPTGTLQTFQLHARFSYASGPIPANYTYGRLTAIYAPFGSTGGNTLSAASSQEGEAPQGTEPDAKPDTER